MSHHPLVLPAGKVLTPIRHMGIIDDGDSDFAPRCDYCDIRHPWYMCDYEGVDEPATKVWGRYVYRTHQAVLTATGTVRLSTG